MFQKDFSKGVNEIGSNADKKKILTDRFFFEIIDTLKIQETVKFYKVNKL